MQIIYSFQEKLLLPFSAGLNPGTTRNELSIARAL